MHISGVYICIYIYLYNVCVVFVYIYIYIYMCVCVCIYIYIFTKVIRTQSNNMDSFFFIVKTFCKLIGTFILAVSMNELSLGIEVIIQDAEVSSNTSTTCTQILPSGTTNDLYIYIYISGLLKLAAWLARLVLGLGQSSDIYQSTCPWTSRFL